jgi:hypothetical protein
MKRVVLLLIGVLLLSECNQKREKQLLNPVSGITPKLIQTCIDSTLALDSGLNGSEYLLDIHALEPIDKQIKSKFLKVNPSIRLVKIDSLMNTDSTWIKYEFFQNPVISIDKVEFRTDGTILIETSKVKASDGAIGTEILLKQQGGNYKCLKSIITSVS